ncbi:UDP-N-acetylmuramoyl-tripeptide--D-alanyl-D-alanine ligase [Tranquillimonas rosea]|uniref:UDP-N-acetylmuramoyl-tripeptide--D-alanyl-D-alanine ligase n=1 Tax=Tranquillimonas rosea TaxID=641238 RepID=A0A1H9UZM4_9RHOB|nr:UDP-N-acetylmuramoyl-tripeptide--D-alanyl-D-alanine ligase [Tranquillimonas rosea]SES14866.1 UDP-N-acetylmuramoyl-tripeptide--D-alanyl-D-alanine ligase [Tranquillimonas rosea]
MTLWTAADAAAATGGRALQDFEVDGLSIDTRSIRPGDMFIALTAARDGHEFVADALSKGAAAAMVSHIPEGVSDDAPLLLVDDVLPALEDLGRAGRARTGAKVVAITGSVGKTSTKEMMRTVFSAQGRTHAAEASFNNHWGVPLTLARMPQDTEFAIVEIGMNHPGEIGPLARMARPDAAMITTVGAAHLAAFDDLAAIAREKASIFEGLEPGGLAVINGDLETTPILLDAARDAGAQIVTFGTGARNHHRLTDVTLSRDSTVARARGWRTPLLLKVGAAGRHFAMNALGVLALVHRIGADRARALCALAAWGAPEGRGQREKIVMDLVEEQLSFELIDDAFNANPTSMAAALEVLSASEPVHGLGRVEAGRRIAVLGDMLELGDSEEELHAALAGLDAMQGLDRVHCVGPRMRALHAALPEERRGRWAETASELAKNASGLVDAGDIVLVKGSKGSRVSLVVDALRKLGHRQPTETEGDA